MFWNFASLLFELFAAFDGVSGSDLTLLQNVQRSWLIFVHLFNHHLFNVLINNLGHFLRDTERSHSE
jgi:hypothetical protein